MIHIGLPSIQLPESSVLCFPPRTCATGFLNLRANPRIYCYQTYLIAPLAKIFLSHCNSLSRPSFSFFFFFLDSNFFTLVSHYPAQQSVNHALTVSLQIYKALVVKMLNWIGLREGTGLHRHLQGHRNPVLSRLWIESFNLLLTHVVIFCFQAIFLHLVQKEFLRHCFKHLPEALIDQPCRVSQMEEQSTSQRCAGLSPCLSAFALHPPVCPWVLSSMLCIPWIPWSRAVRIWSSAGEE